MNKTKGFIYALRDPETKSIRYIGQTINPIQRKYAHNSSMKLMKENNYRSRWVLKLIKNGMIPEFEIIEECKRSELDEREIWWISYYRGKGEKLTNLSSGGSCARGWKLTPEQIEKFSSKLRGRKMSEEHKKKLSIAKTGTKMSESTKRKMSEAGKGRKLSQEHIQKTRRGHIGKKRSLETRIKQKEKWDKRRKDGSIKGVSKDGSGWRASLCWAGKKIYLGMFKCPIKAGECVITKEKEFLLAEYGRTNQL